jgi:hypothetical protein
MSRGRKLGNRHRGPSPRRRTEIVADEEALGEELLRVSRAEQPDFVAGWEKFIKQLGVRGRPVGPKKLREMLLKRGFYPKSNEFSQGIIAMREE